MLFFTVFFVERSLVTTINQNLELESKPEHQFSDKAGVNRRATTNKLRASLEPEKETVREGAEREGE